MAPRRSSETLMRIRNVNFLLTVFVALCCGNTSFSAEDRPNVIIIMSDDQGVGDFGFMGNEVIRPPALDQMHARGGLLSKFYVSPVCASTRASLMTGRYNYRTRCVDTYLGRAMIDPDEISLAECLHDAGYKTGICGKWHMGDNYPMRAMDQGFQESLVHRGGGIGQPSDPIGADGKYTDLVLFKNGQEVSMKGYCTDIYFDAAMDFISSSVEASQPFFAYNGLDDGAPYNVFHWTIGRRQKTVVEHLDSFSGTLVGDAFGGNVRFPGLGAGIQFAACNAHSRREFVKAEDSAAVESSQAIAFNKLLYAIEDRAKALNSHAGRLP